VTARQTLGELLSDEQLRPHLESGETLLFRGKKLGPLERQIERLGFADHYFVSMTKGPHGETTRLTPARRP
jgi:hypothetical protein